MKKSLLKFLVIGMVAALVLTGCGQQAAQNTGDDGATNSASTSVNDEQDAGTASSVSRSTNEVISDDEYIYFFGEAETGDKAYIMRIGDQSDAKPEILYEADVIKSDGWTQYPLGALFQWDDKICFLECRNSDNGEVDFNWISKDGKEKGTLVSSEQMNENGNIWAARTALFICGDSIIFSKWPNFCCLDLNTGKTSSPQEFLGLEDPAYFVAYDNGYYYYFIPDLMNNVMGETLYRKAADSEQEEIGTVPFVDNDDVEMYNSFVPKGDYLYFADIDSIFRIHTETGKMETLASYEEAYNRFALCDEGLYYFKDMSLRLLDLETLKETVFDLPESVSRTPEMIYAVGNDECWFKKWSDSFDYCHFQPNGDTGSFVFLNGSTNDEQNAGATGSEGYGDNEAASNATNDKENNNTHLPQMKDGYYIYTVYGQELRCKTNIWDFIDEDAKTYDLGKFKDYTGCELYVQGEYCFESFYYTGNRNSSELHLDVVKVDPSTMAIDKNEMYLFVVKYDTSAFALYEYTIAGASREVGLTLDQIILHTYAVEHLMENLQDKPFGELFTEYLVGGSGKQSTYTLP